MTFFSKTWTKGYWPLDDLWLQVCWGHLCDSTQGSLCLSPMKIHQSVWIQWHFFSKTWTKGHWLLDDLWLDICCGHMCNSTQASLCPSPMGIHQCMWIEWSILQNTTYYMYILHTYYGQNDWSYSLFLNKVQARQKSNTLGPFKSFIMNNKAFCNLFCIHKRVFTLPDSTNRGCQSFFKLNNSIYKKIYI